MNRAPIGIFDSGIGGLTVVRAIREALPHENIIYLGDTARLPYGTKSTEAIIQFSIENTRFLISRGAKLIVIACYSSTSVAIDFVRKNSPVPVLGVIEPGVRQALALTRSGRIGVIGTTLTISSGAYEKAFQKMNAQCEVMGRACPLLVSIVEEGWIEHPATELIIESYLRPLKDDRIDTLLLGCTHFPLLMVPIKKFMGEINYVDAAYEVSRELVAKLDKNILKTDPEKGSLAIYLTDFSMNFKEIGERFLGEPMENVSRITLKNWSK